MDNLRSNALRNLRNPNRDDICSRLSPSTLVQMSCVTVRIRDNIKAVMRSEGDIKASSDLLDAIVKQEGWWDELLETLRDSCDQSDIADALEAEYERLKTSPSKSSTSSLPGVSGGYVEPQGTHAGATAEGFPKLQVTESSEDKHLMIGQMIGEESGTIEFKTGFQKDAIAKTIASFCNQKEGGVMYLGVQEVLVAGRATKGKVVGLFRTDISDKDTQGNTDYYSYHTVEELKKHSGPSLDRVKHQVLSVYHESGQRARSDDDKQDLLVVKITVGPDNSVDYREISIRDEGKGGHGKTIYPGRDFLSTDKASPEDVSQSIEKKLHNVRKEMIEDFKKKEEINSAIAKTHESHLEKLKGEQTRNDNLQGQVDKAKKGKPKPAPAKKDGTPGKNPEQFEEPSQADVETDVVRSSSGEDIGERRQAPASTSVSGGHVERREDEVDAMAQDVRQMKFQEPPQGDLKADVVHSDSEDDIRIRKEASLTLGLPNPSKKTSAKRFNAMIMYQKEHKEGFQFHEEFETELKRRFPTLSIRPHKLGGVILEVAEDGIKESTVIFILVSSVPCKEFKFLSGMLVRYTFGCDETEVIPVFKTSELRDNAPSWLKAFDAVTMDEFYEGRWDKHLRETFRIASGATEENTGTSQGGSTGQPTSIAGGARADN